MITIAAGRIITTFSLLFTLLVSWGQPLGSVEQKIDSVVKNAIQKRAFPGCVVYAAHKGKPFFSKAYGYQTYDSLIKMRKETIFDLASMTKVTASALCLMKLYEEGAYQLDEGIGNYVVGLSPQIGTLTFRELMAHQSGLPPGILFHKDSIILSKYVHDKELLDTDRRLSKSKFVDIHAYDRMKELISETQLQDKVYRYSDLFFILVPEIIQSLSGQSFEEYLFDNFYDPIGAKSLRFTPRNKFDLRKIAPTEMDTTLRKELIHGYVHDESSALMGGVSGNAGLFGNAGDVAKIWQMLLDDGSFSGNQYLTPQTINLFTSVQYPSNCNYRALVFNKVLFEYDPEVSLYAPSASMRSFGHTGFTGTMVWVDPDNDLLFVFLSNRVHTLREPNIEKELRVRRVVQHVMYNYLDNH
jgi:CubicO group peptidase (beta-lactamase class C family)